MTDARSYLINYVGDAYKEEKKTHTNAKLKIKINYMLYLTLYTCMYLLQSTLP